MSKHLITLVTRLAVMAAIWIGFMPTLSQAANTFAATGSLSIARSNHTATLLPNGKVLVAGGFNGSALNSAELYDPASGIWTPTGSLSIARSAHTATLLPNGKVLVAGGVNGSGSLATAKLYDPATGTWTATGSLKTARQSHTATLLPNGKVLVAGGLNVNDNSYLTSAELYDPATGIWTPTGPLATRSEYHTATLLPNGKVLIAGAYNNNGALTSAELYNPATGAWTATGLLATGRAAHTTTLLPNGQVLVAGGGGYNSLASVELYDPTTGIWTAAAPLATARDSHTATLLTNGKVLVAGGENFNNITSAELYDPAFGTWSTTGSLSIARRNHTATRLPNGKVLVAGGYNGIYLNSAELYDAGPSPYIALEAPTGKPVHNGGTLAYGYTAPGKTKNLTVTVRNTGGADLTAIAASLSGPGAGQFSLVSTPPAMLAAGASAVFTLRFSPTSPGAKTATLSIASNDPGENPFDINLTGTGTVAVPEIVVEQPAGSSLVDGKANKSFGTVKVGRTSAARTFTIKNTGTANLTGLAITKNGANPKDFIVTAVTKSSLAPGKSTTFKVSFKPAAKGTRNAAIHIKSNDANENPFDIKLTGAGSPAAATINAAGKLEFEFTSPDNTAVFRIESK